ncbi:hypothetical protein [Nocardiopsis sp. MG754419]|uniref:hypothetical protein n=1 Tax=Nocardiopsis sp. MG754419 TaxID=2259865 RepID=UPI001BAD4495|nr:hypothetical protein [Nocardiopsis sp. MG754419]MBR8743571.1 hypothetical protein [Nocardiopsis sp. MG754419]
MSSDHLDFSNVNAMGEGSQGTLDQADGMTQDIRNLVGDIEGIPDGLRGPEAPFSAAGSSLVEAFGGLVTWCQSNGMNLSDAQTELNRITSEAEETYAAAGAEIDPLARGVNG